MNLSGRVPAPPPHAPAHISETVQYQLGLFVAPEPVAVKPGAHKAVASAVLGCFRNIYVPAQPLLILHVTPLDADTVPHNALPGSGATCRPFACYGRC
jgi:hypothetical protein